jgi:ribonuclease HI
MTTSTIWHVNIDGAARGNPGPAAYAFILRHEGAAAVEEHGCLGSATNNLAEYTALVKALERAAELGARRLLVHSDSELLVKQMNGEYRVKNDALRELFDRAKELSRRFDQLTIRYVPRTENRDADRLCNEALDGQLSPGSRPPDNKRTVSAAERDLIRHEAVACLRAVAASWARGNTANPSPEAVWDQLWSILEESGAVRAKPPRGGAR